MAFKPGKTEFQRVLPAPEIKAANELTRRWFTTRAELPAAASALGVWPLLTALAAGASGQTRAELLEAAGVDSDRAADVAGALLAAANSATAMRLAIGVWSGAQITLDPDWTARLPGEAVGSLTGDPAADKAALDDWASRQTDGLIDRMPLDFQQEIDLVLASALSVRTEWVTPFEDVERPFQTGPWSGLGRCRTLTNTIHDDVLRVGDEVSVLTVPGQDDIDVLLAIGEPDLEPQAVMSNLIDAAADPQWGRSSTEMEVGEEAPGVEVTEYGSPKPQRKPEVAVQTVRFSLSAELKLLDDAAVLGLGRASSRRLAEFDRLAVPRTYVSQANQKCVATFSATGFEAAALTAIAMTRAGFARSTPKHRHVRASIGFDRPFAYLARHRPSGLILVGGWVAEPERA